MRERDERHAEVIRRSMGTVNDLLAKHVPADRILAAQAEAREWIDATLEQVADEVKR